MKKLLVYSERSSPRLKYILDLILKERLCIDYELVNDLQAFTASELPGLCYARQPVKDSFFLASSPLLFELGVSPQSVTFEDHSEGPVIFRTGHPASALPFDLFAAAFYLLTRYEEHLPFQPDAHGRFEADQSILWHKSLYLKPIVDYWILNLAGKLRSFYPQLELSPPEYKFQATYDIDIPYAYRLKGVFRNLGAIARDLMRRDQINLRERSAVLSGREPDPFDTFRLIFDLHGDTAVTPVFFFLFAHYSDYDKNPAVHNPKFRSLIKSVRDEARVGIHPSYYSNMHPEWLRQEIEGLSTVLNETVELSRQHFLRLQLPSTYRVLSRLGITEDYSMGFAGTGGFRAGTSMSYNFYDLEFELPMQLRVNPFAIMDGTLKDYLGLNAEDASAYCANLLREVRNAGGAFMTIWHNESLSEHGPWKGWRQMYLDLVEKASN